VVAPKLPQFDETMFREALLDLLPNGKAWSKWPGSNLSQTIAALIGSFQRDVGATVGEQSSAHGSTTRALDLIRDSMPYWAAYGAAAVTDLLPEWQMVLGLPDPCLPEDASIDQQVKQCVARFVAGGGNESVCFYSRYAQYLGYDITIQEYAPFQADLSMAETPLAGENAWHTWSVTSKDDGSWLFEADKNVAGDALGGFGSTVLECEFEAIKPVHTQIAYLYSP
jgi:uncharacterized protein YmfQ (DUF2313 family)